MGLGKTAATLSALRTLLTEDPKTQNILIIGPKRVVEHTWPEELRKWDCFKDLRYAVIAGDARQRSEQASREDVHIHLVSRDNIRWLIYNWLPATMGGVRYWPWDTVVIDEMTSFKSHDSKRFKFLKSVRPYMSRVIGLTGTPAPNGMIDLWAPLYLLDKGERLGRTVTSFRQAYFTQNPYVPFPQYELKPGAQDVITSKIKDICLSMETEDYIKLPPINFIETKTQLDAKQRKMYDDFKKDMVININGGPSTYKIEETISAQTAAACANKLLQFTSGTVYNELHVPKFIHENKMDALKELVQSAREDAQSNVIVYYAFRHERTAILEAIPDAVAIDDPKQNAIERWNKGQIPVLVCHPASAGHGLNLQHGGNVVIWYNTTYDLELWQQANKRLHRIGQERPVTVYVITTENCIDSEIYNVVLQQKSKLQEALVNDLKRPTEADKKSKWG
jgi:hypothetical protein